MSKFNKLMALASKATVKASTLSLKVEGEGTFQLKFATFPAAFSATGFENLAREHGARVLVKVPVGEANGSGGGVLGAAEAVKMVKEMTADDTADDTETRKPTRAAKPAAETAPTA